MSISLYTDFGEQRFTDSETDLTSSKFTSATVSDGKWILYKYNNFNDSIRGGSESDIKILTKDSGLKVDIKGVNGSMYLAKIDTDGIVLFKHVYYGGVNPSPHEYVSSNPDITKTFPPDKVAGASSAMVLSASENWWGYEKKNYNGPHVTFEKGKSYPNFVAMGINDKIESIRKE